MGELRRPPKQPSLPGPVHRASSGRLHICWDRCLSEIGLSPCPCTELHNLQHRPRCLFHVWAGCDGELSTGLSFNSEIFTHSGGSRCKINTMLDSSYTNSESYSLPRLFNQCGSSQPTQPRMFSSAIPSTALDVGLAHVLHHHRSRFGGPFRASTPGSHSSRYLISRTLKDGIRRDRFQKALLLEAQSQAMYISDQISKDGKLADRP